MESKLGKLFLVGIGVVLMITFVLPTAIGNMAGSDVVVGEVGGEDIRNSDVRRARDLLNRAGSVFIPSTQTGQYQPLGRTAFGARYDDLSSDPVSLQLLTLEARNLGIDLPIDYVIEQLTAAQAMAIVDRDQLRFADLTRPQQEAFAQAAKMVLDIGEARRRKGDFSKTSRAQAQYAVAISAQQVTMDAIVLDVDEFMAGLPEPTEEEIQAQFETYRETAVDTISADAGQLNNPFGFGYRLPDRVKLEYLAIESQRVQEKVLADVAAMPLRDRVRTLYERWKQSPDEFVALEEEEPATAPATAPTTGPATQPAVEDAAEEPADETEAIDDDPFAPLLASDDSDTKAFLDEQAAAYTDEAAAEEWDRFTAVYDQVLRRYVFAQQRELDEAVRKRTRDTLGSDYRKYKTHLVAKETASEGGEPSAEPVGRVGEPVTSPDYLAAVADDVAEATGIRPTVRRYGDLLSRTDLADKAVVGDIALTFILPDGATSLNQRINFADYAIGAAVPLAEPEDREQLEQSPLGLVLHEPSTPIRSFLGDTFVFRLIDAVPDAAPESVDVVRDQVVEDLRRQAAFAEASKTGQAMVTEAQDSSLPVAAGDRVFRQVGPFLPQTGPGEGELGEGRLSAAGRFVFARQIFDLLPTGGASTGPVGLVAIQPNGKVVIGQVTEVEPAWQTQAELEALLINSRARTSQQTTLGEAVTDYFRPSRIAERVGYVPNE